MIFCAQPLVYEDGDKQSCEGKIYPFSAECYEAAQNRTHDSSCYPVNLVEHGQEKIISVSVSDSSHTLVAAYERVSLIGEGKDQVRLLLSRSLVSVDHGNAIKKMSGVYHHCRQRRSYERRPCSYEVYHNILQ